VGERQGVGPHQVTCSTQCDTRHIATLFNSQHSRPLSPLSLYRHQSVSAPFMFDGFNHQLVFYFHLNPALFINQLSTKTPIIVRILTTRGEPYIKWEYHIK